MEMEAKLLVETQKAGLSRLFYGTFQSISRKNSRKTPEEIPGITNGIYEKLLI